MVSGGDPAAGLMVGILKEAVPVDDCDDTLSYACLASVSLAALVRWWRYVARLLHEACCVIFGFPYLPRCKRWLKQT
eukprot:8455014-Prorocentrum_lima.AAC.1